MAARETWFTTTRTPMAKRKRTKSQSSDGRRRDIDDEADGGLLGFATICIDPNVERSPPPKATPVIFPRHKTSNTSAWDGQNPPPDHWSIFSKILKPVDLHQSHLDAFNFELVEPATFQDFLPPADSTGESYIPPLDPEIEDESTSYASVANLDSATFRNRRYVERLTELRVENTLAYQVVCRALPPGTRTPRIAHLRKFYTGLENMSRYWDTALDNYYKIEIPSHGGEGDEKRQKTYAGVLTDEPMANDSHSANSEAGDLDAEINVLLDEISDMPDRESEEIPQDQRRYRGLRTSTGCRMPSIFLTDTVRGFVESVVWPFSVTLDVPRVPPIVQLRTLLIPVRQTAAVYSIPRERTKAKQGWRGGPVMGLQIRAGAEFLNDGSITSEKQARLDLMKEFGGLMQLAQERRREGKVEEIPGAGKWWKSEPKWGGTSEGKANEKPDNFDVLNAAEGRRRQTARPSRPLIESYPGLWDPKCEYEAIGKDHTRDVDEVFLISALNHHVSVLKLTIHDAYTDLLLTGSMPEKTPLDPNWSKPQVQRTAWFDLFNIDQRVELCRGLWGVTAYLLRDTIPGAGVR